ncbi:NUDIX domain-containing protein [Endothiovibrio diazotrophicus]
MKRKRSYPPRAGAGRHPDQPRTLSAGVVVLRRFPDGLRCLLLRAFQYWDFPKGMVEEGEEPLEGAIREVEEESTLTDLDFRWGLEYRETPPYRRGKVARYYLAESREGEVDLPVSEALGRPEHDEFRWVRLDEAHAMLSPRVQPILRWAIEQIAENR